MANWVSSLLQTLQVTLSSSVPLMTVGEMQHCGRTRNGLPCPISKWYVLYMLILNNHPVFSNYPIRTRRGQLWRPVLPSLQRRRQELPSRTRISRIMHAFSPYILSVRRLSGGSHNERIISLQNSGGSTTRPRLTPPHRRFPVRQLWPIHTGRRHQ